MYQLISRKSGSSLENKLVLYKSVIKPIWIYGIELLCSSKSNIAIIQRIQSKMLRILIYAAWYIFNQTLHFDLNISYVRDVIQERSVNITTNWHITPVLYSTLDPPTVRRWKRPQPDELRRNKRTFSMKKKEWRETSQQTDKSHQYSTPLWILLLLEDERDYSQRN